ncbi:hypothetical protein BaRGS_00015802 [Batillaria attramentaria]|uniref:Uncharacterized protein n=1 Tax=Batillaria attramentaria TaxID=370345 RepID=A0ABD0L0G0_9CAEN
MAAIKETDDIWRVRAAQLTVRGQVTDLLSGRKHYVRGAGDHLLGRGITDLRRYGSTKGRNNACDFITGNKCIRVNGAGKIGRQILYRNRSAQWSLTQFWLSARPGRGSELSFITAASHSVVER